MPTTAASTAYNADFDAAGFKLLQRELKRQGAMIVAIQQVLIKRGMSREDLAQALGVDVNTVPQASIKQAATVSTAVAAPTESRMPQTEGVVSGLYFNRANGDAVLLTKEGLAYRFEDDLTRTTVKSFAVQDFDYVCKNGLAPVIDKKVAELRATISAPAGRPTSAARVTEVQAAAKPAPKAANAPVKIGNTTTMSDEQVANTIAALGYKFDEVVDGFSGAKTRAQAARYWLHTVKGAIKNGVSLRKAASAADADLRS